MKRYVVFAAACCALALPAVAFSEKARRGCISGHPFERIIYCTEIIESGKASLRMRSIAFGARAVMHAKLKNYDDAIVDLTAALKGLPNKAPVYEVRGDMYLRKREFNRAIQDYSASIALKPYPDAYVRRGGVYLLHKRWDLAIDDFTAAIQRDRKHLRAYEYRIRAYMDSKQYEKAALDIEEAIKLKTVNPKVYSSRGYISAGKKDLHGAVDDLTHAIRLDPKDKKHYIARGALFADLKNFDSAIADISKAIELDPSDAKQYVFRGKLHQAGGKQVESIGDFFRALEIGHQSKEVVDELRRAGFNVDAFLPEFQKK